MEINYKLIKQLSRIVDSLIDVRELKEDLNDDMVKALIDEAINLAGNPPIGDLEKKGVYKDITYKYLIEAPAGELLLDDYEQKNWYTDRKKEINSIFWSRYRNYLIDEKHFSPNVVATLDEDTLDQKLMNCLLDPKAEYSKAVLKRGLIIGDVQSGKTSTYIGFMCKAADAGYKVFILLTGVTESLRKQTQERVEEGFIGFDVASKKSVGVGLDNQQQYAMSFTSRAGDFKGDNDKIAVFLNENTNAVVFVIKKNTSTLQKLTNWLVTLNADPITKKINLPMLMIDDEADNASINTSKSKEDPTKINKLIRELANVFTVSNYVGFTATPFANVFIDPETTEEMENSDLFPEDFIVALPTPSNYIGASRIFPKGSKYHDQISYISDAGIEEEDGYSFYFKHKKDWDGALPNSLTDAIYTFYLANAIRDLRDDTDQHRSMLINISRFVKVQKYIKTQVEEIHGQAFRAIKYNLNQDFNDSMKDPILKRIYNNWVKYYDGTEFTWNDIASVLYKSIEMIQIKVVNSSKNSEQLVYPENESLRVIAIGGLALSRGLTLEGLITSYFYRNTCTYDVLMQMGRWFGYRKDYDDLFRIWTHKSSAEWYAEIAEATEQLKNDISLMRELEKKPKDFGIRVRNDSSELKITANNKMRNAKEEYEYNSYFGDIVETPYLSMNPDIHKSNYKQVLKLIDFCTKQGYELKRQEIDDKQGRYIFENVPKEIVINLISNLNISRYSTSFDTHQISKFLSDCNDGSIANFDIAFIEGGDSSKTIDIAGQSLKLVNRTCNYNTDSDRLSLTSRGRIGAPSDGLAGIKNFNGKTRYSIIELAEAKFKTDYLKEKGRPFEDSQTYPSRTWFRYVEDRNPLLLIYLVNITVDKDAENQKKTADALIAQLNGTPISAFAMGLPCNEEYKNVNTTKYKVNKIYNFFDRDEIIAEGEEDDDENN